nr:probable inactive leucine-rich repeat receptor-like protein kinase At3g03770 [Ipomoea batatas]
MVLSEEFGYSIVLFWPPAFFLCCRKILPSWEYQSSFAATKPVKKIPLAGYSSELLVQCKIYFRGKSNIRLRQRYSRHRLFSFDDIKGATNDLQHDKPKMVCRFDRKFNHILVQIYKGRLGKWGSGGYRGCLDNFKEYTILQSKTRVDLLANASGTLIWFCLLGHCIANNDSNDDPHSLKSILFTKYVAKLGIIVLIFRVSAESITQLLILMLTTTDTHYVAKAVHFSGTPEFSLVSQPHWEVKMAKHVVDSGCASTPARKILVRDRIHNSNAFN